MQAAPRRAPGLVLRELIAALQPVLTQPIQSVAWRLTPFYTVTMETAQMQRFLMTQQFDFAAAHRLHCRQLSEEENRRIFGKCNNAHGHGHNYRLEVTVSAPLPPEGEHPEVEHPEGGHPEAAHPEAAHPEAEHPEPAHPEGGHRPLQVPELASRPTPQWEGIGRCSCPSWSVSWMSRSSSASITPI